MKVWAVASMDGSGEAVGLIVGKLGVLAGVLVLDGDGEQTKVSEVVRA